MAEKNIKDRDEPQVKTTKFTVEQLAFSEKFKGHRDALNALLDSKKQYTIAEAERLLDGFLKGKVK